MLEKIRNYVKENSVEVAIVFVLAVILIYTLFMTPLIGRFNNGDFGRLMKFGGVFELGDTYETTYDGTFHNKYRVNYLLYLLPWGTDWVFEAIILKIVLLVHLGLNLLFGVKFFDIRLLTFVYCAIFLVGIFSILKYNKLSWLKKAVLGVFIIAFFTDINYIAYFNSFYGEAGTIIFFFLTIGSYMKLISKDNFTNRDLKFFYISSLGFFTSKTQQLPLLVFMLIIYGALYYFCTDKEQRKLIRNLSIFVVAFCAIVYCSMGDFTNKNNMFQAVFTGVLKDSKTPEKDLEELGLPVKFASLAGNGFYDQNMTFDPMGKEMLEEFYPKASRGKILLFYAKHPVRLFQKIKVSAEAAYAFEKPNQAFFRKGEFPSNKVINELRITLIKKFPTVHRNIYIFISFSLLYFGLCVHRFVKNKAKDSRLMILMLLFILVAGSSQLVLPALGSGEADFGKHLFLINLTYDTMLGISLIYIISFVQKKLKSISLNKLQKNNITEP